MRMLRRLLIFLLVLCFFPLAALAEEQTGPTLDEQVAAKFRRYKTISGEVIAAKDGKIVYQYCYGYFNKKDGIEVTPENYYRIASVSKLVTATAVMKLVEQGLLDLDENIGTILGVNEPFFAANRRYPTVGLTSRMLMTHTSGIWKMSDRLPMREYINVETRKNNTYFYEEKPGTAYHYSNYGAGILGCIIEAITGKRLNDAVSELIFDPMNLDAGYDPKFLADPSKITSKVIRQYNDEIDLDRDFYHSYGNCWMRCTDLCNIGIMLCDYGMYQGKQILEKETVEEMISSQKGKGGITVDVDGLNMQRLKVPTLFPDRLLYGHQGMIDNVLCNLYFDPETRFVFAMVSNCPSPKENQDRMYGIRSMAYQLLKLMVGEYLR